MTHGEASKSAFRCAVVPENSAGLLTIGWSRHNIRVIDTSREAFTLDVKPQTFRRLKEGSRATLLFNDELWEVECTAVFQVMNGQFSVTMARVRDLTRIRNPHATLMSILPMPNPTADPVLPLALLVSFLFACVALPGMGDRLGTAPKIRAVVQDVWRSSLGR